MGVFTHSLSIQGWLRDGLAGAGSDSTVLGEITCDQVRPAGSGGFARLIDASRANREYKNGHPDQHFAGKEVDRVSGVVGGQQRR